MRQGVLSPEYFSLLSTQHSGLYKRKSDMQFCQHAKLIYNKDGESDEPYPYANQI